MYQTIGKCDFHDAFRRMDRNENFSYEALNALYDYLIELEDSTGEKIELDVIALCCEWTESTIDEALEMYSLHSLDQLKEKTVVIWESNDSVLFQQF